MIQHEHRYARKRDKASRVAEFSPSAYLDKCYHSLGVSGATHGESHAR